MTPKEESQPGCQLGHRAKTRTREDIVTGGIQGGSGARCMAWMGSRSDEEIAIRVQRWEVWRSSWNETAGMTLNTTR